MCWLQQRFPEPEQLWDVLRRGPHLLCMSAERLQRQADYLQQRLGWSVERVTAFIRDYPQPFAIVDLAKPDVAIKLLFLTDVVGMASAEVCIARFGAYLKTSLPTLAAVYCLVLVSEHWVAGEGRGGLSEG